MENAQNAAPKTHRAVTAPTGIDYKYHLIPSDEREKVQMAKLERYASIEKKPVGNRAQLTISKKSRDALRAQPTIRKKSRDGLRAKEKK